MSFLKGVGNFFKSAVGGFVGSGGNPWVALGTGLMGLQGDKASEEQRKQMEAAMAQQGAATQAQMAAQMRAEAMYREYMDKALAEQGQGREQTLAATLSGSQLSYDLMRTMDQQMMPQRQAMLGSLQTLPQLQQALGLPAFNINQSIPGLPEMNFAQAFSQAMGQGQGAGVLGPGSDGSPTPATARFPGGQLIQPAGGVSATPSNMTAAAAGMPPGVAGGPAIGETPAETLTPYDGPAFNMEASPMYEWQKKENTEALRNTLAAQGLGGSTYAQREEGRLRESLSAHERERQIRDMFNIVGMGMGQMPSLAPQAMQMPANVGANVANIFGQDAAARGNIYSGMATGLAQSAMNQGGILGQQALSNMQMQMNQANLAAQRPDPLMQALQIGGMMGAGGSNLFGGMFGGKSPTVNVPTFDMNRATAPFAGTMGFPIPKF